MALIKLGALAQDVRGSLAGSTFSRNRGGAYIRQKVSPVQPVSPWSAITRSVFKSNSQRFSCTITESQRLAWDAWAAVHPFINVFGDSIILPAVAAYAAVNGRLRLVGQGFSDDPPETWEVLDLAGAEAAVTVDGGTLAYTLTIGRALESYEGLLAYVTPPILGNRTPQRAEFAMCNLFNRDVFAASADIGASVQGRHVDRVFAVGDVLCSKVAGINKDTGAISTAETFYSTIEAAP
jgi:hypothetical protein